MHVEPKTENSLFTGFKLNAQALGSVSTISAICIRHLKLFILIGFTSDELHSEIGEDVGDADTASQTMNSIGHRRSSENPGQNKIRPIPDASAFFIFGPNNR
ncbi:unnamed protein product [Protopolystoma xenopodis]|uniref:Uncharacterized protein n=1 Tax=Protopolystoma xenopodis TaxID=117903 RepID=A0A3S4ZL08_9PLAT|nr:unnamed protein product [Protopolystoma xenopodis]